MKLSWDTWFGTPSGGAIILGRNAGIPLDVGLGDALVLSMMMLVPTTKLVALSVAVAVSETTGEALLVTDGMVGMGMEADSLLLGVTDGVGASLIVAFPEPDGVIVALLGSPEEIVDGGTSDAGTLIDGLTDGVEPGKPEVPIAPDEGRMPLAEGVTLGVGLATGGVMLAVSDGVGTRPEG